MISSTTTTTTTTKSSCEPSSSLSSPSVLDDDDDDDKVGGANDGVVVKDGVEAAMKKNEQQELGLLLLLCWWKSVVVVGVQSSTASPGGRLRRHTLQQHRQQERLYLRSSRHSSSTRLRQRVLEWRWVVVLLLLLSVKQGGGGVAAVAAPDATATMTNQDCPATTTPSNDGDTKCGASATTTRSSSSANTNNDATSTTNDSNNNVNDNNNNNNIVECGLYMAPSTIPGAGMGIFTAHERHVGDIISTPGGDVCIPVIDMYWHNARRTTTSSSSSSTTAGMISTNGKLFNPFVDYFWDGHVMGMHHETGRSDIEAYCPGLDCAINCHLALLNVEKSFPQYNDYSTSTTTGASTTTTASTSATHINMESSQQSSSSSPPYSIQNGNFVGGGAFTPYSNGTTVVSRYIPPGGELFKYYGDNWFIVRTKTFGYIPLVDDYTTATKLLLSLFNLSSTGSTKIKKGTNKTAVIQDLYESVVVPIQQRYSDSSRTMNALPRSFDDVVTAVHAKDVTAIHQPKHMVPLTNLQSKGVCIDHIYMAPSTLGRNAGNGAFAQRFLPKGTIITVSPLHHLPSYTFMNMYNFTTIPPPSNNNGKKQQQQYQRWVRLVDEVDHSQILLNYCYGVSESTLLLCPYGSGINAINHHATQSNVAIEWATNYTMMHNHTAVTHGTIDDLSLSTKPQLAFAYIATRDIKPGEELFLNYGTDWEDAWTEHVTNYEKQQSATSPNKYASAQYWNTVFDDISIRTQEQQEIDPYPLNLQIRCHKSLLRKPAPPPHAEVTYKWKTDHGYPCRIIDRFWDAIHEHDDDSGLVELYTVQIEYQPDDDDDDDDETYDHIVTIWPQLEDSKGRRVVWMERTDVPRSALRFFDLPYTTDLHQSTAFRHEIGIPDSIFPSQWRNLE